ncbi:ABC transporter permease [Leucobacter sp. CSA1]|uniref:ABC transporter permease n=1 Tax=Leucobacter chromiisoli TaxID=2796471 RepID=A0A934Q713_9MICO|nr:ABC transporter permease [Leucobacter chromiisoli]MBK0418618.1 ABC transporter permease [Leucobacter chromiisoli]
MTQSTVPAATADARVPSKLPKWLVDGGPFVALIAMIVVFTAANPTFLSPGNVGILLSQLAIPLVIATGLTFVILLGGIDLSIEGVMATSSLLFVLTAANDRNDLSLGLLAAVLGIAAGSLFGLANGVLNVRFGIPSFMVTLGMGAVGIGVATVLFGGRSPRLLDPGLKAIGTGNTLGVANIFLVALAVLILGYLVQRFTRLGRYGYVIGGDEAVAKLSGVSVARYKIGAFVVGGTTSGIAGVLVATQLGVGSPVIGEGFLFTSITAVVLGGTLLTGGRGGVLRSLVGVAIIVALSNGLILMGVNSYVQIAVQGVVIIAAVVVTGWRLRTRVRVIK